MIYLITDEQDGCCKIGYSESPQTRLRQIDCGRNRLRLAHFREGNRGDERALHKMLEEHRLHGEWFALNDCVINAFREAPVGGNTYPTQMALSLGISVSYACQILSGKRTPSPALEVKVREFMRDYGA